MLAMKPEALYAQGQTWHMKSVMTCTHVHIASLSLILRTVLQTARGNTMDAFLPCLTTSRRRTRWKLLCLKCRGLPALPLPFSPACVDLEHQQNDSGHVQDNLLACSVARASIRDLPVQSARKFSAVRGTTSLRSCACE